MNLTLPVAAICHGPQILAAAGVLKGRKLTGYFTVKPEVEMAGGQWVTAADDEAIVDGNLITATTGWGIQQYYVTLLLKWALALFINTLASPQG